MADHHYTMTISLNVLRHLGIGLYSNIPAVLSEIVANSWDADATKVVINIDLDVGEIVIYDNGYGMSKSDLNKKYLTVGYSKRVVEPGQTPLGRDPMGRKGIGKLSVFSIADEIEVHSVKGDERNGLIMHREDIEKLITGDNDQEKDYHPISVDEDSITLDYGTKIVLRRLKKRITSATASQLRKRLARRFSIIGERYNFHVIIDGDEISAKDRDYYRYIEFLWHFDDEDKSIINECVNLRNSDQLGRIVDNDKGYVVGGWIATIDERKNIDENDNAIVIFAHGKLIHEDIIKDFSEGGIYSKYLIGEIDADFMDLNDEPDIVTSNRQSVIEDDERYQKLKIFVWDALKEIQRKWSEWRREEGVERALNEPIIREWYSTLGSDTKKHAERLFGKIESLRISDPAAKKELYKASMIGFEKMRLQDTLSLLDSIETEDDFMVLTKIFRDIDEVEAVQYYQIAKGRLEVVKKLENILPTARERVLQEHIFDHLWLLDPSWERASTNRRVEQTVTKEFHDIDAKLTDDEKSGRIDIRYKTAAGKHIIIELKKYDRKVKDTDLLDQVGKYISALRTCLENQFPDLDRTIECICILGQPPKSHLSEQKLNGMLREADTRYITYDTLIRQALESYEDYLKAEKELSHLNSIINSLDELFE